MRSATGGCSGHETHSVRGVTRPAAGRRLLAITLVVCLITLAVPAIDAQVAMPQKGSRLWNLLQWTDALLRHTPGEADEALGTLDGWTSRDLDELKVHFQSTLRLIRDPTTRIFMRPPPSGSGRAVQIFYSLEEIRQLLALAPRRSEIPRPVRWTYRDLDRARSRRRSRPRAGGRRDLARGCARPVSGPIGRRLNIWLPPDRRPAEWRLHELRSETARHVNGSAVRRELRHPVECAAVDERNLDSFV